MTKIRNAAIPALLLVLIAMPALAQNAAEKIVLEAQTRASSEHKNVFLTFSASWCGPCHQLDSFLETPEMKAIVDRYFVVANVHIAEEASRHPERNTPGSDVLLRKLTGNDPDTTGVPFIVFLDAGGKAIVNSDRPIPGAAPENIGYPVLPEEIAWFMEMLKRGAPAMTAAEAQRIEMWLTNAAKAHE